MTIKCRYIVKGMGELTRIMLPRPITKDSWSYGPAWSYGLARSSPSRFSVSLSGTEDITQKYAIIKWPIDTHKSMYIFNQ